MKKTLQTRLNSLSNFNSDWANKLTAGVERELLRVDLNGGLSKTSHPQKLGSALTHPHITTDYSESLLELITPPFEKHKSMLDFLLELHIWCAQNLADDELLWAHSMPSYLPKNDEIPIANYGTSNQGKMRHIYRKGLDLRYGRSMQTIAGLHYNFSLPKSFWQIWKELRLIEDANLDFSQEKHIASEGYFALIRNFRRYSWAILYLFGATPNLDKSFVENIGALEKLEKLGKNSYGLPYATSLRMSSLGYQNPAQSSLSVCFNSVDEYTKSLMEATSTKYEEYAEKGVIKNGEYLQLNANILQIENEFYSDIRPKRTSKYSEQPSKALMRDGVEYIEVRNLDINPFVLGGIDLPTMDFLDLFLLYCLLSKSDEIQSDECNLITENKNKITLFGRDKSLMLHYLSSKETLAESGMALMDNIEPLAEFLDKATKSDRYTKTLAQQRDKFIEPEKTPSGMWLDVSRNKGFLETGLFFANLQTQKLRAGQLSQRNLSLLEQLTQTSLKSQQALEAETSLSFEDYLKNYFS